MDFVSDIEVQPIPIAGSDEFCQWRTRILGVAADFLTLAESAFFRPQGSIAVHAKARNSVKPGGICRGRHDACHALFRSLWQFLAAPFEMALVVVFGDHFATVRT